MRALSTQEHFTYAFAHLAMRDEVVFKSIVGLLSGRTHNQWQHVASSAPDLLILGMDTNSSASEPCSPRVVLKIANLQSDNSGLTVHWPLRANEVFERLEQVSKLLSQSLQETAATGQYSTYKLTRWPAQEILGHDPAHLRLATLLGARAISADDLSSRSGLEPERCLTFLQALKSAGLLLEEKHSEALISESAPQGFFARLRAHLGLSAS